MKPKTQSVLRTLYRAAQGRGQRDGWVCSRTLARSRVGGWKKDSRLHEIRKAGFTLERTRCRDAAGTGPCSDCRYATTQAEEHGKRAALMYAFRLAPDTDMSAVEQALA